MKNLIVTLTLTLIMSSAHAQFQKGMKEVGGSFLYSTDKREHNYNSNSSESETKTLNLNPKFGYFITNSSVLGLGFSYNFDESSNDGEVIDESKSYAFNPYYRNYQKIAAKFYYTSTINLLIGFGNTKTNNDQTYDLNQFKISFNPGICYFLSEKVAIRTSLGEIAYHQNKLEGDDNEKIKSEYKGVDFNFGLSHLSFGATYFF
ncbi:MAG: hypothetical protein N4A74_10035 [Carboxylicivirga sp.]|jgi:hypothetical protein|nr:hypothetical protein [Carboxylicivirga sp.]